MRGYWVEGHDNGSYAFHGRSDIRRCDACGQIMDKWNESLAGLKIKRGRKWDISTTYDGIRGVSEKFRRICVDNGFTGTIFRPLPSDPGFYALGASRSVKFDVGKAGTKYAGKCSTCGRFESVAGASPLCLVAGESLGQKEFVRTDIEFGWRDEQCPIIICGSAAGEVLKTAGLRKLELLPMDG